MSIRKVNFLDSVLTLCKIHYFFIAKSKKLSIVRGRSPPFNLKIKNSDWRKIRMAYNHGKEERKWRIWKETEEKKMRGLGVGEDKIRELHTYDWEIFNSERRYYEKIQESGTYLETINASETLPEINTVEDLLDNIENQELYQLLHKVDRLTLQILLWKMDGYSSLEISEKCGLSVNAVNFRMWHLRKKLKKYL